MRVAGGIHVDCRTAAADDHNDPSGASSCRSACRLRRGRTRLGLRNAREEAEYWARAYLGLLAEGNFSTAASLLGAPGRAFEVRSPELQPLGVDSASDQLDDQLRVWCATDGICVPALDPYPNVLFTDVECTEAPDSDTECWGFRESWLDPDGGQWRLGFTVAESDGTAFRLHPGAAEPENIVISVGVTNGRVWVRGLPPSRTFGDPASRLPQLTVSDTAASTTFEVPETSATLELSTDGSELCISLRMIDANGAGASAWVCSGDPEPLSGMMNSGLFSAMGSPTSLFVVAAGVVVQALDADGEPLEWRPCTEHIVVGSSA